MKIICRFLLALSNVFFIIRTRFNFSTNFRLVLYLYSKGLDSGIIRYIMENPEKNIVEFLKDENYTLEILKGRKENIYGRKN
jgi:hypothetical protein